MTSAWTKPPDIFSNGCKYHCPPQDGFDRGAGATKDFIYLNHTTEYVYYGTDVNNKNGISQFLYTGRTLPDAGTGHKLLSFYEVILHELGHWMGLCHTDQSGCKHDKCMIMNSTTEPNQNARDLSCDDICMFKLLYCPEKASEPCPPGARRCNPPDVSKSLNSSQSPQANLADACGDSRESVSYAYDNSSLNMTLSYSPIDQQYTVSYSILSRSFVTVMIYDILGKPMATLLNTYKPQGNYTLPISTDTYITGVYFLRLECNGIPITKRFSITK